MDRRWLNVWQLPYSKKYYLTHPQQYIKGKLRATKLAKQRAQRGYCENDVWELGPWIIDILPQMLRDLSKGKAYPGVKPFETPEKWRDWLNKMANQLEQSSEEYCYEHKCNEYSDAFHQICEKHKKHEELTIAEKILKNKYFMREKEIYEERKKIFKSAMYELIEYWDFLWD